MKLESKNHNIWFTADFHEFHERIIGYTNRPFKDVTEMNTTILDNYNSLVSDNDIVFYLGDIAFGEQNAIWTLQMMKGVKHFIIGNHDRKYVDVIKPNVASIHDLLDIEIDGQPITLCHYAMRVWHKSHFDSWQLYGHCLTADTEILTNNGFKKYNEITYDDKTLSLNTNTHELEYTHINDIFIYNYDGKIISFKCKSGEITVTPNHRMLLYRPFDKKLIKETAILTKNRSHLCIPINGKHKGIKYNKDKEWFILLGLIISDGHFHIKENDNSGNGISIYQKPENAKFIEKILKSQNVDYVKHYRTTARVPLYIFYLKAEWVKNNIYKWIDTKEISKKLLNIRGNQFFGLLGGLLYGDGRTSLTKYANNKSLHHRKNPIKKFNKAIYCQNLSEKTFDNGIGHTYYTSNEKLKDQLSHICTLNGIKTRSYYRKGGFKNGCWCIDLSKKEHLFMQRYFNKRIIKRYKGIVWCISNDNETIVARKNGFIFITGNSHGRLPPEGKQWDVGVDYNGFKPLSYDDLKRIMKSRPHNDNYIPEEKRR